MYKVINTTFGRNIMCIINKTKTIVSDNTKSIDTLKRYKSNIQTIILLSPNIMKKYNDKELYNYVKNKYN